MFVHELHVQQYEAVGCRLHVGALRQEQTRWPARCGPQTPTPVSAAPEQLATTTGLGITALQRPLSNHWHTMAQLSAQPTITQSTSCTPKLWLLETTFVALQTHCPGKL